jgi:YD repeat-containing protein
VGNVTSVTSPSGTVPRTHDDADRIDSTGFVYDDTGALLTDGTRSFTYDALGRLTGVSGGGHTAAYLLDGDGQRVSQTVDSVTTLLDLDLRGDLSSVLVAGDAAYLPGMTSLGSSDGTDCTATLADAQGSLLAEVDAAGVMAWESRLGRCWDGTGD